MFETLFATLAAKIAAGSVAVAMAATAGLTGTGNLPDGAQTAVSEVLSNVGINVPLGDSAEEALAAAEGVDDEDLVDVDEDGDQGEPNENATFGQGVAEEARDGGVNGQGISERAREMAAERKAAGLDNRPVGAGAEAEVSADANASVDAGTQSQTGTDKASDTPAESYIPNNIPGGPGTADQHRR